MRRILCAIIGVCFLTSPAWADTSSIDGTSGMGVLENDYVKAGVNKNTGTLGSGGNASPGLLFDSSGTGTFNTSYDYLTPGSPFDGFSVKIDDTNYTNNNTGTTNITGTITGGLTDGTDTLTWSGEWLHGGATWGISNQYTLGTTNPFIDITTTITAGSDASTLYFGRFIDPDARAADGDSSSTDNVLGYGSIPAENVVFSEALSSRYALGLYSTDSNVDAGISGWSQEADGYTENAVNGDGSLTNTGDNTIGLTWAWTGVSTGDIVTVNYSYIFGPSAFDAATDAVDGGAGGGADILTGELTDVGSATDAASGPTVTGSTTSTLTSFPVTDDGEVQTIAPVVYTGTADIYSDGTTGDVTTTTSSLPQVTARVDQYTVMDETSEYVNRTMMFDPFRGGGFEDNFGKLFINGTYGKMSTDNGYDAKTGGVGVTGVINTPVDNLKLIISVNKVVSEITGEYSSSEVDKKQGSVGFMVETDKVIGVVSGNYSKNNYSTQRGFPLVSHIPYSGRIINGSETTGKDMWGSGRVYYKASENFVPFIGGAYGKSQRDGVEEQGLTLTKRTIAESDETFKYAEGGVRLMYSISDFDLFGQVGYSTDKWITADAGVTYNVSEYGSINVTGSKIKHDGTDINKIMLRGNIKF